MAWTQTDLDTIEAAIVKRERRVRYADGREVEYASTEELFKVRDAIKSAIAGTAAAVRCTYASFTKD
jgi:hypothetical protein